VTGRRAGAEGDEERRKLARARTPRGRWLRALPWAVPALVLGVIAWRWGSATGLALGPALAAGLVAAHRRGGEVSRGALAGLRAGLVPFAVVILGRCLGHCDPAHCLTVCALAGLGAALALHPGLRAEPPAWRACAIGFAALTAALPCLVLGALGLALAPTVVVASLPAALRRPA